MGTLLILAALTGGTLLLKAYFGFPAEYLLFGLIASVVVPAGQQGPDGQSAGGANMAEEAVVKRFTIDLGALADRMEIDDSYFEATSVKRVDVQSAVPNQNNVIVVGDPVAAQGFMESVVCSREHLRNLKTAKFLEFNTAQLCEVMANPMLGVMGIDLMIDKTINGIRELYCKKGQKVVLVLNFQDLYRVEQMTGGIGMSFYGKFKEAIEDPNISVMVLSNPELYEKSLKDLNQKKRRFGTPIDLRTLKPYSLREIAGRFSRKIKDIYHDTLPEGVKVSIDRAVRDKALELIERYYSGAFAPVKYQEIIDKIITKFATRQRVLKAKRADIAERLFVAGEKLQKLVLKGGKGPEIGYAEETVDRILREYDAIMAKLSFAKEPAGGQKVWEVGISEITRIISEETGIPEHELGGQQSEKLKNYQEVMKKMLIGQDEVIEATHRAFLSNTLSHQENRPIGVYLLAGPTGVGKTEFARALATHMYGSVDAMVRLDMGEFMNEQDAYKLIGAPPGYVGYEAGGQLTNHVYRKPYSVVLLDEIEKAHPKVIEKLLPVFDRGEITDNKGRRVSFRNTIILMTSNIGYSQLSGEGEVKKEIFKQQSEALEKLIGQVDGKILDKKTYEFIGIWERRLLKLKQYLDSCALKDAKLEGVLAEMYKLLWEPEHDDFRVSGGIPERKTFVADFYRKGKGAVDHLKDITITELYKLIGEYKSLAPSDEEGIAAALNKMEGLVNAVKQYAILRVCEENQESQEEVFERVREDYADICRSVSSDAPPYERLMSYTAYLKKYIEKEVIRTIERGKLTDEEGLKVFRPEMLGRIITAGNIICFNPLSREDLTKILDIKIENQVNRLLRAQGFGDLLISEKLKSYILTNGYDAVRGARPMERVLKMTVLAPLADLIIGGNLKKGSVISADISDDGRVTFDVAISGAGNHEAKGPSRIMGLLEEKGGSVQDILRGETGWEPEAQTAQQQKPDMRAMRKRFEIDVPLIEDIEKTNIDTTKIEDELTDIEIRMSQLKAQRSALAAKKSRVMEDQGQRYLAVLEEIRKVNTELQLMEKKKLALQESIRMAKEGAQNKDVAAQEQKEEQRTQERKAINEMFENLTLDSYAGEIIDIHPPFRVLEDLTNVLTRKRRNYPMLLERSPLVQKKIIDSLADNFRRGKIEGFEDTRVLRLRFDKLKPYLGNIGLFESRMKEVMSIIDQDDASEKGLKTVVVIDLDEIKPELEKIRVNPFLLGYFLRLFKGLSTVSFVMTTSNQNIIEDDSFEQYFSLVEVNALSSTEVMEGLYLFYKEKILEMNKEVNKENIDIDFEAMRVAVKIWEKNFSYLSPFDKLQEWFSNIIAIKNNRKDALTGYLMSRIAVLKEDLREYYGSDVTSATIMDDEHIMAVLGSIETTMQALQEESTKTIGVEDLFDYLETKEAGRFERNSINVDYFKQDERSLLLKLEERLGARLIGQDDAIKTVAGTVRVAKAGLKRENAPVGVFLFAGPTGVGKTELGLALAEELGLPRPKVIDMTNVTRKGDLARIFGAPPAYIGYDAGAGELAEYLEKYPQAVIIFDEIDKIEDKELLNSFLQIMEDGRITTNQGKTLSFKDCVIIFTTNIGMTDEMYQKIQKFALEHGDADEIAKFIDDMRASVEKDAKQFLSPEFMNRLDALIVFNPLLQEALKKIVNIHLDKAVRELEDSNKIKFRVGSDSQERDAILSFLVSKGYRLKYAARELQGTVRKRFVDEFSVWCHANGIEVTQGDEYEAFLVYKESERGPVATGIGFRKVSSPSSPYDHFSDKEKELAERIARHMRENPAEPVSADELLVITGISPGEEISQAEFEMASPAQHEFGTAKFDFTARDKRLNGCAVEIGALIPKTFTPVSDEGPEHAAEAVRAGVEQWVQNMAVACKMTVVSTQVYRNEQFADPASFFNMRESDLAPLVEEGIQGLEDEKPVTVSWEYRDGEHPVLKVKVSVNRKSPYIKKVLYGSKGRQFVSDEVIDSHAPRALAGLLKFRLTLGLYGARYGFCEDGERTDHWIELPVPVHVKSKVEQAGGAEQYSEEGWDTVLLAKTISPQVFAKLTPLMAKQTESEAPVGASVRPDVTINVSSMTDVNIREGLFDAGALITMPMSDPLTSNMSLPAGGNTLSSILTLLEKKGDLISMIRNARLYAGYATTVTISVGGASIIKVEHNARFLTPNMLSVEFNVSASRIYETEEPLCRASILLTVNQENFSLENDNKMARIKIPQFSEKTLIEAFNTFLGNIYVIENVRGERGDLTGRLNLADNPEQLKIFMELIKETVFKGKSSQKELTVAPQSANDNKVSLKLTGTLLKKNMIKIDVSMERFYMDEPGLDIPFPCDINLQGFVIEGAKEIDEAVLFRGHIVTKGMFEGSNEGIEEAVRSIGQDGTMLRVYDKTSADPSKALASFPIEKIWNGMLSKPETLDMVVKNVINAMLNGVSWMSFSGRLIQQDGQRTLRVSFTRTNNSRILVEMEIVNDKASKYRYDFDPPAILLTFDRFSRDTSKLGDLKKKTSQQKKVMTEQIEVPDLVPYYLIQGLYKSAGTVPVELPERLVQVLNFSKERIALSFLFRMAGLEDRSCPERKSLEEAFTQALEGAKKKVMLVISIPYGRKIEVEVRVERIGVNKAVLLMNYGDTCYQIIFNKAEASAAAQGRAESGSAKKKSKGKPDVEGMLDIARIEEAVNDEDQMTIVQIFGVGEESYVPTEELMDKVAKSAVEALEPDPKIFQPGDIVCYTQSSPEGDIFVLGRVTGLTRQAPICVQVQELYNYMRIVEGLYMWTASIQEAANNISIGCKARVPRNIMVNAVYNLSAKARETSEGGLIVPSRLGARKVLPGPVTGAVDEPMDPGYLSGPLKRLALMYPAQYRKFQAAVSSENCRFKDALPSSGGVEERQDGVYFFFEKETRGLLKGLAGVLQGPELEAVQDAFKYMVLIHEATELLIRPGADTITPDINAEIAALFIEAEAYISLARDPKLRADIRKAAAYMDSLEKDIDDRFLPFIDFVEQRLAGKIPQDLALLGDETIQAAIEFVRGFPYYSGEGITADNEWIKAALVRARELNMVRLSGLDTAMFSELSDAAAKLDQSSSALDKDKAYSFVFYAEDLLKDAILYDMEETFRILKKNGVMENGLITLYAKDPARLGDVERLAAYFKKILGEAANVMIVKQWEDDVLKSADPAKEAERLAEISGSKYGSKGARHVKRELLAIVRGNRISAGGSPDWTRIFKEYGVRAPLFILKDDTPGFFSFAQVVHEALLRRVTAAGKSGNFWIIGLEPIRAIMTDDLRTDYIRYKEAVLEKA